MTTPAEDLAKLVLQTLDTQQEYFRTKNQDRLREAKALERKLRKAADEVLHPEHVQPTLFEKGV